MQLYEFRSVPLECLLNGIPYGQLCGRQPRCADLVARWYNIIGCCDNVQADQLLSFLGHLSYNGAYIHHHKLLTI